MKSCGLAEFEGETRAGLVAEADFSGFLYWGFRSKFVSTLRRSRHIAKAILFSPFFLLSSLFVFVLSPEEIWKSEFPLVIRSSLRGLIKRGIDIFGTLIGLILSLPFFIFVPLAIKIDSSGPIFYRQKRIGRNRRQKNRRRNPIYNNTGERRNGERRREDLWGSPFYLYKFRTMRQNAEKKSGPVWAIPNDPRITKVGRFLRKTRIDEIPQFLNILRGEMSLVGPRPERPYFVKSLGEKVPEYPDRLMIKPGLTGPAQIECGYDSSVEDVKEKVKLDIDYVHNGSLIKDLKIILFTVGILITGKGAY